MSPIHRCILGNDVDEHDNNDEFCIQITVDISFDACSISWKCGRDEE